MNKATAFEQVKRNFALTKPTRVSNFGWLEDMKGVILVGHEENVSMVIYSRNDLLTLKGLVDAALQRS